jgi:hypothetical protein
MESMIAGHLATKNRDQDQCERGIPDFSFGFFFGAGRNIQQTCIISSPALYATRHIEHLSSLSQVKQFIQLIKRRMIS